MDAGTKEIVLSAGETAIVDADDFDFLSQWKWSLGYNRSGTKYAIRGTCKNYKKGTVYMHRVIMNTPKGLFTDHINHNGLDNRKINLRIVTGSQNQWNRRPNGPTSKLKGVSWKKDHSRWEANITLGGKTRSLGFFKNEEDAAAAYKVAAKKHHGEYCYNNSLDI